MSVKSQSRHTSSFSQRNTESGPIQRPKYEFSRKTVRFVFPDNDKVRSILLDCANNENIREYEQLICTIRDSELRDEEVEILLNEANQCISLLNQELRLFVEVLLLLKWTHRSESVVNKYRSFLINLLCAHNYHAKFALDQLVANFSPTDTTEWPNGEPTKEDYKHLANIHEVLKTLLKVVPMCRGLLYQSIVTHYPYFKKPTHVHECYLYNILWIIQYEPNLKLELLYLIFNRLITLDVNAPKEDILRAEEGDMDEDIFGMDEAKSMVAVQDADIMKHPVAHTLDVCLDRMFSYVIAECHDLDTSTLNWEKTKLLYQTMTAVFDKIILPTYNIHHVQFVMFLICSLKQSLSEGFLKHLWKKVSNPNVPSVHRQTAVSYIASLLSRASYINLDVIQSMLGWMAEWVHSYITTQDGLECVNSDRRVHSVFYSVCQALFYIVAFRHKDLTATSEDIAFLDNLNLTKIVTCRLNPLKICQPTIVQSFAAVTRTYQLAYCYTIIEHNARASLPTFYFDEKGSMTTAASLLEAFFPFDPYLLKRSGQKLTKLYIEYKDTLETNEQAPEKDEDDFLSDHRMEVASSHCSDRFSYSTSPGFKYKS